MAPLAMEEMRASAEAARRQLPGETLTSTTALPTDRESGSPLVRVLFPTEKDVIAPVLTPSLAGAVHDLLEEWNFSDELGQLGAKPNMRCLLYGAPGVGKTKLARFIAWKLGLPCVEARLDGLISSFLGTTARNIGSLFEFANRYRCVLFLDEFDAIAKARDDSQELGEIKRVVNTLLQSLDARNGLGITIAATNHEHLLDAAVWRRFDAQIEMSRPDEATRGILLERFFSPLSIPGHEARFMEWITEGMSGADIETLVDGVKRFLVVNRTLDLGSDTTQFSLILDGIRRQAALNSRTFQPGRAALLTGSEDDLDKVLQELRFTQTERGSILGLSQSAISRREKRIVSSTSRERKKHVDQAQ